jgi:hypothetical protein
MLANLLAAAAATSAVAVAAAVDVAVTLALAYTRSLRILRVLAWALFSSIKVHWGCPSVFATDIRKYSLLAPVLTHALTSSTRRHAFVTCVHLLSLLGFLTIRALALAFAHALAYAISPALAVALSCAHVPAFAAASVCCRGTQ